VIFAAREEISLTSLAPWKAGIAENSMNALDFFRLERQ